MMRRLSSAVIAWLFALFSGFAWSAPPESGWWWNPAESGSGYAIELQGDIIYMAAFLYEDSGDATWYAVALFRQANGSYRGDLERYVGGKTLTGPYHPPTSSSVVAVAELSFPSARTGTMVITFPDGRPARTIPIERFPLSSPTAFAATNACFESGWWWNSLESGTGDFVEVQGSTAYVARFLYRPDGRPTWYAMTASLANPLALNGMLDSVSGGQSLSGPYRVPVESPGDGGSASYSFSAPALGSIALANGARTSLERFIFGSSRVTSIATACSSGGFQVAGQPKGCASEGCVPTNVVGAATGLVDVVIEFVNPDASPRTIHLPAGLTMTSVTGEFQNGLLFEDVRLTIPASGSIKVLLHLYCLNASRNAASDGSGYEIGPVASNPGLLDILRLPRPRRIDHGSLTATLVQFSLWEVTDGSGALKGNQLALLGELFGLPETDPAFAEKARQLMESLGLASGPRDHGRFVGQRPVPVGRIASDPQVSRDPSGQWWDLTPRWKSAEAELPR